MNERRVLVLTSVASMVQQFLLPNIMLLLDMGYRVDVACNFIHGNTCSSEKIIELQADLRQLSVDFHQIDFARNVFDIKANIHAYQQVRKLTSNSIYQFIHCHSPIGGVCGRLAGHRSQIKVIYTAHGFHFYKGSPLINWLLFYPVEKYFARYTDALVTINREDYLLASRKFNAKRVYYLPGIGIDMRRFSSAEIDRTRVRATLGIPDQTIILLSVGELSIRKNHAAIIQAMSKMTTKNIIYLIAGQGDRLHELESLSEKLKLSDRVRFLGYRSDLNEIYRAADIFCFPSLQEGLPVALMEAMACGLPVVCSNIRGNTDLIENRKNGFICEPCNSYGYACAIDKLAADQGLRQNLSKQHKHLLEKFSVQNVMQQLKAIYLQLSGRGSEI